ncbi:unnamed protein product [Ostreobium quekettii]|uniref:Uncharacterized protein n=1 Tax=Ostreobium quekettii TaxID=121088 RepID=A0A8S1J4T5_9CHLO|nr:unnamed protein product [Ostreobium quekettii]
MASISAWCHSEFPTMQFRNCVMGSSRDWPLNICYSHGTVHYAWHGSAATEVCLLMSATIIARLATSELQDLMKPMHGLRKPELFVGCSTSLSAEISASTGNCSGLESHYSQPAGGFSGKASVKTQELDIN